ncbi:hypothetical protein [Paenibacillus daejeonensis]|uniref:hypothetical protein n=1 Tax=Paenibacillus daejeonensis TaxID=135193 RepID=UPI0003A05C7A|nr:hypothetical protein [Paenibacillus daejeonensis]
MNLKVKGTVKHGGEWLEAGGEIRGIDDKEGQRLIDIGAAELLPKTKEEKEAEEQAAEAEKKAAEEKAKADADAKKAAADKARADKAAAKE